MQVRCLKRKVIVDIGSTKWFFDGGLRRTLAGDTREYERRSVLIEAVCKPGRMALPEELPRLYGFGIRDNFPNCAPHDSVVTIIYCRLQ